MRRWDSFYRVAGIVLFMYASVSEAQNNALTLSGYVKESGSGHPIANAIVTAAGGAARSDEPTDTHGLFILSLSDKIRRGDNIRIHVYKVGYNAYDEIVTVSDRALEFFLVPVRKTTSRHQTRSNLPTQPIDEDRGSPYSWQSHIIVQDNNGRSINAAHVLLISPNATYIEGISNSEGAVFLKAADVHGMRTVFCAAAQFEADLRHDYDPDQTLTIRLEPRPTGGSVIIPDGTGEIPGLKGLLNPILDTSNRTYLYAHNIAIEGGKQQPVSFVRNQAFNVEDNQGNEFELRIVEIIGTSSLIDFKKIDKASGASLPGVNQHVLFETGTVKQLNQVRSSANDHPQTLQELFGNDFPNLKKLTQNTDLQMEDDYHETIKTQFYLNFPERAKFIGFFIPASDRTYETCIRLADTVQSAWDELRRKILVTGEDTGGSNSMDELVFTGRVFLYHESPLSIKERAALIDVYSRHKLDVQFRGREYLDSSRKTSAQYTVPLAENLRFSDGASARMAEDLAPPEASSKPESHSPQNCPGGICIGRDNNGIATVNNYAPAPRIPSAASLEAFKGVFRQTQTPTFVIRIMPAASSDDVEPIIEKLGNALTEIGWKWETAGYIGFGGVPIASAEGIECYSMNWNDSPAQTVAKAMKAAGLACKQVTGEYRAFGRSGITVLIGRESR